MASLRMRRLSTAAGSIVMVPLDHGVSMGPLEGLQDPAPILAAAASGGATCVTLHKGLVGLAEERASRGGPGILLHLSASTDLGPDPHDKRLVGSVEEALRRGCDGVSIHVNLGSRTEARQLEDAGRVATQCQEWGMPLVAMVYPRGPAIQDPRNPVLVAHAARLGAELGADAVKVPYTGSPETFRDVVRGCPVPVLVAGGALLDPKRLLEQVQGARQAGARGASIGRNVFQDADPQAAVAAIAKVFP